MALRDSVPCAQQAENEERQATRGLFPPGTFTWFAQAQQDEELLPARQERHIFLSFSLPFLP